MRLHLDIESFSTCDLRTAGLYRYAAHPSTELLVVCYAFGDGPVAVWWPYASVPPELLGPLTAAGSIVHMRYSAPDDLVKHIEEGGVVAAHNAQFERVMLNTLGHRHGLPRLEINQMVCTAAKAATHGLPRSLEACADALGSAPKMKTGRTNMLALAKPRSGKVSRYTIDSDPARFLTLAEYCVDDVKAERDIDARLRDLPAAEQAVWQLDQLINDRGVAVDRDAIGNVQVLIDEYRAQLEVRCVEWTGFKPTQTDKLATWVRTHGYPQLVDFTASEVETAVKDPTCPEPVKRVLRLRSTHAMKAVSKFATMRTAAGADDRLRGMMLYYGAGTGRWSSLLVQLQNIFRPVIKDPEVAIEAFRVRDLDWVRTLYAVDPMKVMASTVRGHLVAGPGKRFMALDFAGIESRDNAWLFDEEWKLKAFREYDTGVGPDTYKLAFAKAFGVAHTEVLDWQRQIGKVMELALGFEGGVNAFVTMVGTYKIDLTAMTDAAYPALPDPVRYEAEKTWQWAVSNKRTLDLPRKVYVVCDALKKLWRANHPRIAQGWKDLNEAAIQATETPGMAFAIRNKKIAFMVWQDWLFARLPSGRRLAYYQPEVGEGDNGRKTLTYMGVDTKTRRWMRVSAYGGRFCENLCQAVARDLLVNGMFNLEKARYPVVLTVHDEVVMELDGGFGSLEEAKALMCSLPAWANGMPVTAAGWEGTRYRK